MNVQKNIKLLLSILLVVIFIIFFYQEFQVNWNSFNNLKLVIDWKYFSMGLLMMIFNYFCTTISWHIGINGLAHHKKLSFVQSIALVNISQLGKYVPGKIWSYVVQIYWLSSRGFPKQTILYLNIITTILPIIVSLVLGGILLIMLTGWHHLAKEIVFIVFLLLMVNLIMFNHYLVRFVINAFSKIIKKEVSFYPISPYRMIFMELIYVAGAYFWALAGVLISISIGFDMDTIRIISVSSAMLLGDVIGFLVMIAPGGLGVREGTMYIILKGADVIQFALIFPIVIRLLSIITDFIMGILSLWIMNKSDLFSTQQRSERE
jgi:glycosyltransferase 2 family protein